MINNIISTYKKNRITINRTKPWASIISRITSGIFNVVFPIAVFKFVFYGTLSESFVNFAKTSDYISYIVLGSAINVLALSTIMNIGRALTEEIREGTIENIILSPGSRVAYFLGNYFEQIGRSLLEAIVIIIVGFVFGARYNSVNIFKIIFAVLILCVAFFTMAVFVANIMVILRDTYIIQSTISILMDFMCGFMFPVEYLPSGIRQIAQIFPLTHALKLCRNIIMNNESLVNNLEQIINITILSLVFGVLSILLFRKVERKIVENVLI